MKYLTLALTAITYMALLACTPPNVIRIHLQNKTSAPLTIKAEAAGLRRHIRLGPNQTWDGWIPNVSVDRITVTIKQ